MGPYLIIIVFLKPLTEAKKTKELFKQIIFKFFVLFFSLIFILKLDEPIRNEEIFIISLFSKVQIWVTGVKKFFLAVFG